MAYTQMVNENELSALERQVMKFLEQMADKEGDFALAMLVPSHAGLSDKWNLVLSARWIDREGLGRAIPNITSSLLKHVSGTNAHKFERVSVLPTNDRLVVELSRSHAPSRTYRLLSFPQAEGALVFRPELPQDSKRHPLPQVSTRA